MSKDDVKIFPNIESMIASDCFDGGGIEPIPVSEEWSRNVCKAYLSGTCAFRGLRVNFGQIVRPACFKGTTAESIIREKIRNGQLFISAKGDNCSGPPDFAPN